MLTQEQVNDLLEQAKPSIIQSIKDDLKQTITWEMKQECAKQVKAHTEQWIKENVIPEITSALVESKEGMISMGAKLGPAIVDELVKSLIEAVSENMKNTYDRKKIFEALLG